MLSIADAEIESRKSLHSLISICTTCWWNLNMIIRLAPHKIFELFDKKNWVFETIFDKALAPFWKSFIISIIIIEDYHFLSIPKITIVRQLFSGIAFPSW